MKVNMETRATLDRITGLVQQATARHKGLCSHTDPTKALAVARDEVRLAKALMFQARKLAKECLAHPDFDDLASLPEREEALQLSGAFVEPMGV